ncbi:MAG: iron ABC transporter permease [Gammaproteobacteria bacterium]|nr:iron ABC transporter permease [Gammaproteobacteria bacterium]
MTLTFLVLALLSLFSLLASLALGSYSIPLENLPAILSGSLTGTDAQIVTELRWPRTLTAFVTGGLLGLAGALMQVLLRNPLADPYILGISGGAATGALLAITFGLGNEWVNGSAFSGAMLSMLLVYLLSRSSSYNSHFHLLLTGVVLAAGWGAIINILLILANAQSVHSMLFWLMGDLSNASQPSWWALILLLAATLISWLVARDLNLLTYGDHKARSLGSNVRRVRQLTFVLAALCTAIAVSMAGTIGFIGLIVPHLIRLILGSNHRLVLPAAVLGGGSLLVLADLGARTLLAPQQLPVGVITALIGVPVFLYLLRHRRNG